MIFGMQFTNNGSMLAPISLLKFSNCSECLIQNIFAISNYGNSLNGIEFINPINCALRDSIIANLKATNNCNGIKLSGESIGNVFRRVSIFNNTAGSSSIGFFLEDSSISNVISDCQVVELTGGNAYGYAIHGSNSIKNVIGTSSALNLEATQPDGFSVGFYIDGSSSGTINECASSYNIASSGLAAGIMFSQTNGGSFWNVNECKIVRNLDIDESNSFGINALAGTGNLFLKNFAYDNGSNPSNQMIGVPNGSVSQLNISNLNSAPTPWANVVIIP